MAGFGPPSLVAVIGFCPGTMAFVPICLWDRETIANRALRRKRPISCPTPRWDMETIDSISVRPSAEAKMTFFRKLLFHGFRTKILQFQRAIPAGGITDAENGRGGPGSIVWQITHGGCNAGLPGA